MSLRYYLYISDTKVDMLLAQIDERARRKIATQAKIDLKVLSAGRTSEVLTGDDRVARLEAVTRWMETNADVGTVEEPGTYFQGCMMMSWGPLGPNDGPVYFGGVTETAFVGLGGSRHHIIGNTDGRSQITSQSAMPFLLAALAPETDDPTSRATTAGAANEAGALQAVHLATQAMNGPPQLVEFVAKRLLVGPSPYPQRDPQPGMSVLLGSPLYVAQVD